MIVSISLRFVKPTILIRITASIEGDAMGGITGSVEILVIAESV